MKRIIISEKNKDRIEKAIAVAQGKATERTVSFSEILKAVERFEKMIPEMSKKDFIGCTLTINPNAQKFPEAYKWAAMATFFTIEKTRSGYVLTDISRRSAHKGGKDAIRFTFTERAKQVIMACCESGLYQIGR